MEWRLYDPATVPAFTTPAYFAAHDWIPGTVQRGYTERLNMVVALVSELELAPGATVTDLGAGDGSLLELLGQLPNLGARWGYDLGEANRARAAAMGRDVRAGDIIGGLHDLALGDLIVCTEVVEHLLDPHAWLAVLAEYLVDDRWLVLSSPSTETDQSHYEAHAWAWDVDGYIKVADAAGLDVVHHRECSAGFQAIACRARGARR